VPLEAGKRRSELLEARATTGATHPPAPAPHAEVRASPVPLPEACETSDAPRVELEQVTEAWDRSILDAVRERSIPVASLLTEARPTDLAEDTLTLEFPAGADFHRRQVAEPQNIGLIRDALYEVTGRKLSVVLESGGGHVEAEQSDDEPAGEDLFIAALKERFDAEEVEDADT
jgi:hypothetical protein